MRDKFSSANPPTRVSSTTAVSSSNTLSPTAQHHRQMVRQVWLPLALGIIVVLALMILTVIGAVQGSPQVERFGNLSSVLVILPLQMCGLVVLVIVGGLAFGMSKLLGKMPGWMLRAQLFMLHLALSIRRAADTATKPVFATNTFSAKVRALWRRFVVSK